MNRNFEVASLNSTHERAQFSCGVEALDRYFLQQVGQDIRRRVANCFVAVDTTTGQVAGYYTLSATSVPLSELEPIVAKRLPRYPSVPAALLGRLAVGMDFRGQGLGAVLVADAADRSRRAELAVALLLAEAKDDSARAFYEHLGFRATTSGGLRLILPL